MAAQSKANEIQITRIYDAPVALVWDAWTDPEQVAKWWGPRGFTITTHSKDQRPGGHWSYTMHGPDGTNYENKTIYFEVEDQAKLVYDHGGNDQLGRPALFRVTVLFAEVDGKTKMEMTLALPTAEAAKETRTFIKRAGGDSTWDRLAEYLDKEQSDKDCFFINRTFDAPLETMFEMWTSPEHFTKWLAPTGFEMQFLEVNIQAGGSSFFTMFNESGVRFYGRAAYLQIEKPHYIVYTQQFCDEQGNVSRHPLAPTWPETMLTTVTLCEEGPDRTRVTVKSEAYGAVTAEELAVFIQARGGMTQGWTGSFDKLEALLTHQA